MKTKNMQFGWATKPALLALALVAVLTTTSGCRNSMGTGVSGHRGGIATGVMGTSRTIDPTSDVTGTRFAVKTVRGQISPSIINDHFIVDTMDDWGPIVVTAVFPDGQTQERVVNWTINGVGVTAYVGGNAGVAAGIGLGAAPSVIGDARSKAGYSLDLPRPHFVYQKPLTASACTSTLVTGTGSQVAGNQGFQKPPLPTEEPQHTPRNLRDTGWTAPMPGQPGSLGQHYVVVPQPTTVNLNIGGSTYGGGTSVNTGGLLGRPTQPLITRTSPPKPQPASTHSQTESDGGSNGFKMNGN